MKPWLLLLAISALTLGGLLPTAVAAETCANCGKQVSGRYLKGNGKVYCSQACFEATLPQCAACGKRLVGRHLVREGKSYCSQACLETVLPTCKTCHRVLTGKHLRVGDDLYCGDACYAATLPPCELCGRHDVKYRQIGDHVFCATHAAGPRCNECHLPFLKAIRLDDGRYLCAACRVTALFDQAQAAPWYDHARRELQALTGFAIPEPPPFRLVDRDALAGEMGKAVMADDASVVRGFYRREVDTQIVSDRQGKEIRRLVETTESIHLLSAQTRENFTVAAVHELTHDLLADHFPALRQAPLWASEGICQYLAAIYCRKFGHDEILHSIETSRNPVYGDGYRYFKTHLGDNNWSGLKVWLERTDFSKLPAAAPATPGEQ